MITFLLKESCTSNLSILRTIYIAKTILNILCTVTPIILIAVISKDLFKKVVTSGETLNSKDFKTIATRLVAGLMVFMIPTLVKSIMSQVDTFDMKTFSMCWNITKEDFDNRVKLKESSCNSNSGYVWDKYSNTCRKELKGNNSITTTEEQLKEYTDNKNNKSIKNLNYISQTDYPNTPFCSGSTVAKSGCGAAAFAMIASTYSNSKYNMEYVANWFCKNRPGVSDGGLKNEAVVDPEVLNTFGLKGEIVFGNGIYSGRGYNSSNGNAMLNAVKEGKSVMFGMPGHWAVAGPNTNCNSSQVYLYDPGLASRNGCYTPQELFQLTYNARNFCSSQNICGWDIGIALS